MSADAALALLPKFSTLVALDGGAMSFTSAPLDVSRHGSAQFQAWRGPMLGSSPTFKVYLEESVDGETWTLPPGGTGGFDPGQGAVKSFSYAFRLRWFRLRVDFQGQFVTCWAEGLLR